MNVRATSFRSIIGLLGRRERILLIATTVCTLSAAGCLALAPLILGRLTDNLLSEGRTDSLIAALAGSYLAVIATPKILQTAALYSQSMLRIHSNHSLLARYFSYLCEQSEGFFVRKNSGELSQEVIQASNDLYIVIRNFSFSIVSPAIQIGIAVGVLIASHNAAVAGVIVLYSASFLANSAYYGGKLNAQKAALLESGRSAFGVLADSVANIQLARQFNGYDVLLARYQAVLNEDRGTQAAYWKISVQLQVVNALLFTAMFGVSFSLALYDVIYGGRSVGNFVLIAAYTLILLSPIESLGNMSLEINQSLAALSKFVSKLSVNAVLPPSAPVRQIEARQDAPAIEFEAVSLIYPGANGAALKNISVSVWPGECVVITGPSGAGKSSLIKTLTRQYDAHGGTIRLFGQVITSMSIRALNDRLGYVSQDVLILKDTLRVNLLIARPSASDGELIAALERAELTDIVNELPRGLDTNLGDRGTALSGGQRQRLALARLFLRDPDVILIDEGTSSLDVATERRVLHRIREAFISKTILIVSHRPTVMQMSDRLIVVSGGAVDDTGRHEELQRRNAFIQCVASH